MKTLGQSFMHQYALSIYTGLLLIGFYSAYTFEINAAHFKWLCFLIAILLCIHILYKNTLTLLCFLLIGMLFNNQPLGILDHLHFSWINQTQEWINQQLQQTVFDSKTRGLCKAILIGFTDDIGYQQKKLFKELSIIHIIAISGMHLHIIAFYARIFLFPFSRFNKVFQVLSIIMIWTFALVANSNPSIIRAAAQTSYSNLAIFQYRKIIASNKIAFSALAFFILSPSLLLHIGFQLSIAAIMGIQYLSPIINRCLRFDNVLLQKLWLQMSITLSAQLICTPLIAFYTKKVYTQFLITNLLISPLFTLLLHLLILFLISSPIPLIQQMIAKITFEFMHFINYINNTLYKLLPHPVFSIDPQKTTIVYIYLAILICVIWLQLKKPKMLVWLLLLTCMLRIYQCAQSLFL